MSPPKKESLLIILLPPHFQEKKSITIVLVGTSHLILSCYIIVMYVSILLCYTLSYLSTLIISDEQGFGNPCGYMGKGTVGMGRGKNL